MKPLRMTVPARLRPHLIKLLRRGLDGNTERQVAIRLIEERLREDAKAVPPRRGLFA